MNKNFFTLFIFTLLINNLFSQQKIVLNIGHSDAISSIACSPDGKYFITGSDDKTIKLWDVATLKEIKTFHGHEGEIRKVAFTRDGKNILSCDGYTIRLWDIQNGKQLWNKQIKFNPFFGMFSLSPDGKTFLCAPVFPKNHLEIRSIINGDLIKSFAEIDSDIWSIEISPNGKYILSGLKDNTIKLWDIATGKEIRAYYGHNDPIRFVTFSPDGNSFLSVDSNGEIKLWNIASEKELNSFQSSFKSFLISTILFLPDNYHFIVTGGDRQIEIFNIVNDRAIKNLIASTHFSASCSAISSDGNSIFIGGDCGGTTIFDTKSFEEKMNFVDDFGVGKVKTLAITNNNRYIVWVSSSLELLNIETGKIENVKIKDDIRGSMALIPSLNSVIIDRLDTVEIYDIDNKKIVKSIDVQTFHTKTLAVSLDGKHFVFGYVDNYNWFSSEPNQIRLWDIETNKNITSFGSEIIGNIYSLAFSKDGNYCLSGSENFKDDYTKFVLWDAKVGWKIHNFNNYGFAVTAVAFSPDGISCFSGNEYGELKQWTFKSGKLLRTFIGHKSRINSIVFSPKGNKCISASDDRTIKIWDTATGNLIYTLKGHSNPVNSLAVSSDGRFCLSGADDGTVKVWNINSGKELLTIWSDYASDDWVAYTPEGKFDGSMNGINKLHFVDGFNIISIEKYYNQYYTANLISNVLKFQ